MTQKDIEKYSLILLRFQLLNLSKEEMIGLYSSDENFKILLSGILYNMQEEPGFFAMDDDIIKKIEQINNELRFQFVDDESRKMGNCILKQFAHINYGDQFQRSDLIREYMMYQVWIRDYIPDKDKVLSYDEFTNLLSFDYITYSCLLDKDYEDLYQSRSFLASTNVFLKEWPEFYKRESYLLPKTKEIILDSIHSKEKSENHKQYKKMAKRTLERIKHY